MLPSVAPASHETLCCVTGTLWSLRSPQLIQEQISADTYNPTSLWVEGGGDQKWSRGRAWFGGKLVVQGLWESWRRDGMGRYQKVKTKEEKSICWVVLLFALSVGTAAPLSVSSAPWRDRVHDTVIHIPPFGWASRLHSFLSPLENVIHINCTHVLQSGRGKYNLPEYVFTISAVIEKYLSKIPNPFNCSSVYSYASISMWKELNNEFSLWDRQKFNRASCISWLQVVILTTEQLSVSNFFFSTSKYATCCVCCHVSEITWHLALEKVSWESVL